MNPLTVEEELHAARKEVERLQKQHVDEVAKIRQEERARSSQMACEYETRICHLEQAHAAERTRLRAAVVALACLPLGESEKEVLQMLRDLCQKVQS